MPAFSWNGNTPFLRWFHIVQYDATGMREWFRNREKLWQRDRTGRMAHASSTARPLG